MGRYYKLARGTQVAEHTKGFAWPYEVAICFDVGAIPVALSEGVAHGAVSGVFSAADAIGDNWKSHFEAAGGVWLLSILKRMANGETVSAEEALNMYSSKHGSEPESYKYPLP
jgi:hypothetical protein